jgi:four helix bundle protein
MDGASDDLGSSYAFPAIEGSIVAEPTANPVRDKSFIFALDIIKLNRALVDEREYVISKQLMRSGTAIGAIVEEAIGAESRRDFLHKMSMAHKEARETHYWLRLLDVSDLIRDVDLSNYLAAADELIRLLVAITRTVKEKSAEE